MTRTSDSVPLNGISRRTFCKGAAVLGVWGGLASFGLAGCAPHSRAEELADSAPWKAGTYTTEVTGHNAPYTMTVTFSDDAITAIDTSANQESLGVGADALKALQQQAIDNQTINIDAVTGATLIPLLTLGIPGDGCVAIMLSALMINGLNPGLSLFTEQGDIMYAIMLGLILVNAFMFVQGKFLTNLFAKVVSVPQEILTPIIVMFCFAGAFSVNKSYFDVLVALVFCAVAWLLRKIDFPAVPILLGLVLGKMAETNFRRALMVSRGSYSIFVSSPFCIAFLALTALVIGSVAFNKMKARKKKNG